MSKVFTNCTIVYTDGVDVYHRYVFEHGIAILNNREDNEYILRNERSLGDGSSLYIYKEDPRYQDILKLEIIEINFYHQDRTSIPIPPSRKCSLRSDNGDLSLILEFKKKYLPELLTGVNV